MGLYNLELEGEVYTLGDVEGFLEITGMELRRDTFYILCPYGIGDTLYVASLVESFKRYRSLSERVCLIIKRGHDQIPDWFDAVDEKIVSDELVKMLDVFCILTGTWELNNFLYGHFRKSTEGEFSPEFSECEANTLPQKYRKLVFHLPVDCMLEEPKIAPQEELLGELIGKYNFGERTVILMPHAYSIELVSAGFWEEIARLLRDLGYEVFTNVKDDSELPVRGTTRLCADMATMAALCERCRLVIALRSGICDMLYYTDTRLIVINGEDLIRQWNTENKNERRHIYSITLDEQAAAWIK